jgi:hypothetical protein
MAASRAQINWASVEFGTTTITRISTGSFGYGGTLAKWKGDTDRFPTVIANVDNDPHASFTSGDVGIMMNFTPGQTGSLSAVMNDALGVTSGNVTFVLNPAVFENADGQDQHAQFGTATGTWQGYSTDGVTNPLVVTYTGT